jgi:arabinogalactan endo-1,4-beta-galactosidase
MKKDFVVSSVFDRTPIVEYAAASKDGEELYARLRADGITHLLVNAAEGIKLGKSYGMFYWDARARGVFDAFWDRHVVQVYAADETQGGRAFNRLAVYELADKLPAGTPPAFNIMREIIMRNVDAK